MLARKNQLSANKHSQGQLTMEKSRLTQARTLALRRQDYVEVKEIDVKLADLAATTTAIVPREEDDTDMLAKVNERNRKANLEAVRKAEVLDAERKRRERRLAATGAVAPHDPSARLKILPRLFNNASTPSRFVFFPSSPRSNACV
jgi:RNA polymerase-associated protein RTF1